MSVPKRIYAKKPQPPIQSESVEQKKYINWARGQWFFPYVFAIPNGGSRSKKRIVTKSGKVKFISLEGKRLKAEGVKAGVSDLMIAYPCNGKSGFFLEAKRTLKSKTKENQSEFLEKMRSVGYAAEVGHGWQHMATLTYEYFGLDLPTYMVAPRPKELIKDV